MDDLLDSPLTAAKPKVGYAAPIVWMSLLLVGLLFRSMHWPFGSELIIGSTASLFAFSLSKMIFITKLSNIPLAVLAAGGSVWTLIFLWGAFFNGGYPYNFKGLVLYGVFFAVLFIIHSAINYSQRIKAK